MLHYQKYIEEKSK